MKSTKCPGCGSRDLEDVDNPNGWAQQCLECRRYWGWDELDGKGPVKAKGYFWSYSGEEMRALEREET